MKVLDKTFWIGIYVAIALVGLGLLGSFLVPHTGDFAGSSIGLPGYMPLMGCGAALVPAFLSFLRVLGKLTVGDWTPPDKREVSEE